MGRAEASELRVTQEEVLQNGEGGKDENPLGNETDAEGPRLHRRPEIHAPAVDMDLTGVGIEEAVENSEEGRLPGAVLPQDRVHRVREETAVDVVIGKERAEVLGYTFGFQ
jgi:hypothetical protein